VSQARGWRSRPQAGQPGPSSSDQAPPVAILCGGRGTRLQEHTQAIPKPLVEIGGMPIVWHVIQLYAVQGFRRFLLATGYRGELIEQFAAAHTWPAGVSVQCVDTGPQTQTGGRVKLLERQLAGEGRFCVTYADGLADVDLEALLAFHAAHGALASMTVVRPRLQFGVTELEADGRVTGFREKPTSEHWINGGFFCFSAGALDYIDGESALERAPLERLAAAGELRGYRHGGFWECMDTYKDAVALNDLWASGRAPWRLWGRSPDDAQPDSRRARNSGTGSRIPRRRRSPA
jgi:glucose-1-phosphate cytidylyltransferase